MKQVSSNVWVETETRGCNFGFVTTTDGIVMIDSPHKPSTAMWLKSEIAKRGLLRYIINTEPHGDHWTGNAFFDAPVIAHEGVRTRMLNTVEVTPSSGSDTDVSVPVVDGLAERKVRPDELFADTAYGSGRNAFEASRRGTELVSPVAGSAPGNSHEGEGDGPPPLTAADFQIDVTGEQATVCPAGHPSIEETWPSMPPE